MLENGQSEKPTEKLVTIDLVNKTSSREDLNSYDSENIETGN